MLVIDDQTGVWVHFDNARMALVDEHTDTWERHMRQRPDKLRRFARRGLLDVDAPRFWEYCRERWRRGFMGELAVAAYLRAPYDWRLETAEDRDVDGVQVRTATTKRKPLITRTSDKSAPYALAVPDYDTCVALLQGWLPLKQCNVAEYYVEHETAPCFMVPPTALQPMRTLRQEYEQRKRRVA